MKINMQQWAQDIIDAKDVKILPVQFFPTIPLMEDMGVEKAVKGAEDMAKVMVRTIEEYPDLIACMTGMDLTIDTEAFGGIVNYSEKQAPNIHDAVISTPEEIRALQIPDIHSARVDVQTQATVEAEKVVKDRPVFGGMLGPFSLDSKLFEVSKALMMTVTDPESMHILIQKATDYLILRAKEYKAKGANGIFIAEPTAGLLSPDALDAFSSVYVKQIVEAVQDDYFFLVLHDCGKVTKSVVSMYNTGCKGFHFGNSVKMTDILPQVPADVLMFGNIDPSSAFFMGTPEEIYEMTTKLLEDMKPYPNFVLSSGCDLAPAVEKENIDAFYKACRDFNAKNA